MKKKTVLKLLFIASCLVAVCSLFYNNETSTLDSLAFQNVEALASGENDDNAICVGYGSVDCRTYKVKYKVTDFSLETFCIHIINRYQCNNLLYRFPRYLLSPIFDFSQ